MSDPIPEADPKLVDPDALATRAQVYALIEDEPSDQLNAMVDQSILIASDMARHIGFPGWKAGAVPKSVGRLVAVAVARYVQNPEGLAQSRAGDEALGWNFNPKAGLIYFTEAEEQRIAALNVRPTWGTIQTAIASNTPTSGRVAYVPVSYGGSPFPYAVEGEVG